MYQLSAASLPAAWRWACCSAFIVSASWAHQRSCWPCQARRRTPEAVVAGVAVEAAVVFAVASVAVASVAAVFAAEGLAGAGAVTQDQAAILAIAGVG